MWATSVIFLTDKGKQSRIGRKFAHSGHLAWNLVTLA
jgi:hypothetical protein